MSSQPPPTTDSPALGGFDSSTPDDELLVAYLDGELDQGSASQVEMKLASDAQLRRRLNDLRATWDLLEELPPAEPNPRFAQSTIEMVAMSAGPLSNAKSETRRTWWWIVAACVALPLLFTLGYAVVRRTQRLEEQRALEMLHVLADWDALKDVGSYEWLQQVRTVEYLGRVARRSSSLSLGNGIVPETISERRTWIQSLSATSRDRLSANLVEFKRVAPAERQSIIKLADQIYAGTDPEGDLQAARDYSYFLNQMSVSDRAAHLDQKDVLDDLRRRVNRRMVEVYAQELAPDSPDRIAVERWIEDMMEGIGTTQRSVVYMDLMRRLYDPSESVIDEVDLNDLLASLTPEAQQIVGHIRSDVAQHAALILYFVNAQSFLPGQRSLDRAQLTKVFDELPPSAKGLIEFLPPEVAQEHLGKTVQPSAQNETSAGSHNNFPFGAEGPNSGSSSRLRDEVIERSENNTDSRTQD